MTSLSKLRHDPFALWAIAPGGEVVLRIGRFTRSAAEFTSRISRDDAERLACGSLLVVGLLRIVKQLIAQRPRWVLAVGASWSVWLLRAYRARGTDVIEEILRNIGAVGAAAITWTEASRHLFCACLHFVAPYVVEVVQMISIVGASLTLPQRCVLAILAIGVAMVSHVRRQSPREGRNSTIRRRAGRIARALAKQTLFVPVAFLAWRLSTRFPQKLLERDRFAGVILTAIPTVLSALALQQATPGSIASRCCRDLLAYWSLWPLILIAHRALSSSTFVWGQSFVRGGVVRGMNDVHVVPRGFAVFVLWLVLFGGGRHALIIMRVLWRRIMLVWRFLFRLTSVEYRKPQETILVENVALHSPGARRRVDSVAAVASSAAPSAAASLSARFARGLRAVTGELQKLRAVGVTQTFANRSKRSNVLMCLGFVTICGSGSLLSVLYFSSALKLVVDSLSLVLLAVASADSADHVLRTDSGSLGRLHRWPWSRDDPAEEQDHQKLAFWIFAQGWLQLACQLPFQVGFVLRLATPLVLASSVLGLWEQLYSLSSSAVNDSPRAGVRRPDEPARLAVRLTLSSLW